MAEFIADNNTITGETARISRFLRPFILKYFNFFELMINTTIR